MARSGLWKAQATLMALAAMPAPASSSTTAVTAALAPEIATWDGLLWLAMTTSG